MTQGRPFTPGNPEKGNPETGDALTGETDAVRTEPAEDRRRIGAYRLLDFLGRGAQGTVHKAEHVNTGQVVALKVIRDGYFSKPSDRELFLRECRTISKLDHPAIVPVIDDGAPEGVQYFAMPFIEGIELHAWARTRADLRFGFEEKRLPVFLEICDAIEHAHHRGIIHRDLKPDNIRVDRLDRPFILDFGLASDSQRMASESAARGFKGTYFFASPEQVKHERTDQRSDVYTLGVLLYFLLTDVFPFTDAPQSEFEWHHAVGAPPKRARRRNPRIPRTLDHIVHKALAHNPNDRYQSAAALADDIRRFIAGEKTVARAERIHRPLARFIKRYRGALLIAIIAAGAITLAARSYQQKAHIASTNPFDFHMDLHANAFAGNWDQFIENGESARIHLANLERSPAPGYHERAATFRKRFYELIMNSNPPQRVMKWLADDPPIPGFGAVIDANHDLFAETFSADGQDLWRRIHDEFHRWDELPPDMIQPTNRIKRSEWKKDPAYQEIRMSLPNYTPGMRFLAEVRELRTQVLELANEAR